MQSKIESETLKKEDRLSKIITLAIEAYMALEPEERKSSLVFYLPSSLQLKEITEEEMHGVAAAIFNLPKGIPEASNEAGNYFAIACSSEGYLSGVYLFFSPEAFDGGLKKLSSFPHKKILVGRMSLDKT